MSTGIHASPGPIAAVLDFEGGAEGDYERLSRRLNPTCRQRRLQGCLFHWMKPYPEGFRVIEFWSGRDLFDRFLDHEFRPLLRELGLVEPRLRVESVPEEAMFGGTPDEGAPVRLTMGPGAADDGADDGARVVDHGPGAADDEA